MIKEYNKQRQSQAFKPVLFKEVLRDKNLLGDSGNIKVVKGSKKVYPKRSDEYWERKKRERQDKRERGEIIPKFRDIEEGYRCSVVDKVLGLYGKERAIFEVLYAFRSNRGISVQKRSVIAKKAKCTVRHVTRVTNKFVELGWISKDRKKCWDQIQYTINPRLIKGATSFSLWFSLLSKKQQELYMEHGMLPGGHIEKSIPKKRIIPRASYWKKREEEIRKFKEEKRKIEGQKNRKERAGYVSSSNRLNVTPYINIYIKKSYLSKNQDVREQVNNNFVSSRSKYPVSRGIEMDSSEPNLSDIGFSGVRTSIASRYELNLSQKLKLFAFSESCLESVFESIESYASPKRGYSVFIYKCEELCKKRRMKPDWQRYTALCKQYSVDSDVAKSPKREMYKPHKVEEEQETVESLVKELLSCKKMIREDKDRPDPLGIREDTINFAKNKIRILQSEIEERINEDIN